MQQNLYYLKILEEILLTIAQKRSRIQFQQK